MRALGLLVGCGLLVASEAEGFLLHQEDPEGLGWEERLAGLYDGSIMGGFSRHALASTPGLLADRRLELNLSDSARKHLIEVGYDPSFGARPLKRLIQREVENPLSLAILEGRFHEGDRILAEAGEGGLVFEKA